MSRFTPLTEELHDYLVEHGSREDEVLRAVREETAAMGDVSVMQIAPDQGALLGLLVRLLGGRRAIEVGTFTGYSAICIARALGEGGRLICCELDSGYAETASRNLERAGVAERAEVRVGPAIETLRQLPAEPACDFAFVDADKVAYGDYYEALLPMMRPGGLIAFDNALMDGRVLDPQDDGAVAMDRFNRSLGGDERIDLAIVGVADGLALARVR